MSFVRDVRRIIRALIALIISIVHFIIRRIASCCRRRSADVATPRVKMGMWQLPAYVHECDAHKHQRDGSDGRHHNGTNGNATGSNDWTPSPDGVEEVHTSSSSSSSAAPEPFCLSSLPVSHHSLITRDGTHISYHILCPGGSRTMVFAAGLGIASNWTVYASIIERYTRVATDGSNVRGGDWSFLTWEYRGLFNSGGVGHVRNERAKRMSIPNHAEDLRMVMRREGLDKIDLLVGYSMGVSVSLEFAHVYPHRVDRLMLLNGTYGTVFECAFQPFFRVPFISDGISLILEYWLEHPTIFPWIVSLVVRPLIYGYAKVQHWRQNDEMQSLLGDRYFERFLNEYVGHVLATNTHTENYLRLFQELQAHALYHTLRHVHTPTLLISGALDGLTPARVAMRSARRMGQHARHVMAWKSTHCCLLEEPAVVMRELQQFLEVDYKVVPSVPIVPSPSITPSPSVTPSSSSAHVATKTITPQARRRKQTYNDFNDYVVPAGSSSSPARSAFDRAAANSILHADVSSESASPLPLALVINSNHSSIGSGLSGRNDIAEHSPAVVRSSSATWNHSSDNEYDAEPEPDREAEREYSRVGSNDGDEWTSVQSTLIANDSYDLLDRALESSPESRGSRDSPTSPTAAAFFAPFVATPQTHVAMQEPVASASKHSASATVNTVLISTPAVVVPTHVTPCKRLPLTLPATSSIVPLHQRPVAILTCVDQSHRKDDDRSLIASLLADGIPALSVVWDCPESQRLPWNSYRFVVVRSPWGYFRNPSLWAQVLKAIEDAGVAMANDLEIVRWNSNKAYIKQMHESQELRERRAVASSIASTLTSPSSSSSTSTSPSSAHVNFIPTLWLNQRDLEPRALAATLSARGWTSSCVLKPTSSAGGANTIKLPPTSDLAGFEKAVAGARELNLAESPSSDSVVSPALASLTDASSSSAAAPSWMLQPFQPQIVSDGEYSFLFLNTSPIASTLAPLSSDRFNSASFQFVHAARKLPKQGSFLVQPTQGGILTSFTPTQAQIASAREILSATPFRSEQFTYVRVDVIRSADGDKLLLMEIEAIEPDYYSHLTSNFASLYYRSIAAAMSRAGVWTGPKIPIDDVIAPIPTITVTKDLEPIASTSTASVSIVQSSTPSILSSPIKVTPVVLIVAPAAVSIVTPDAIIIASSSVVIVAPSSIDVVAAAAVVPVDVAASVVVGSSSTPKSKKNKNGRK